MTRSIIDFSDNQVNTQQAFFTAIEDCASAILCEQSEYERELEGMTEGATGAGFD